LGHYILIVFQKLTYIIDFFVFQNLKNTQAFIGKSIFTSNSTTTFNYFLMI